MNWALIARLLKIKRGIEPPMGNQMDRFKNAFDTASDTGNATIKEFKRRANDMEDLVENTASKAQSRISRIMSSLFSTGSNFKADGVAIANDLQKRGKEASDDAWNKVSDAAASARKMIRSYQIPSELTSKAMNVATAAAAGTAKKLMTVDGRKAIKTGVGTARKVGTVVLLDPRVRMALVAAAAIGVGYAVVQAVRNRQDEAAEIARVHGAERVAARRKLAAARRAEAKKVKAERRAARSHARRSDIYSEQAQS